MERNWFLRRLEAHTEASRRTLAAQQTSQAVGRSSGHSYYRWGVEKGRFFGHWVVRIP